MSEIDFNKMLARIQYGHADEAHEAMAAIRAHVEALEKEVESLNNIVILSERIGDIRAAVKQELTDAFQKRYEAAERDRERFRDRALPPGVTLKDVRGVLSDALPHVIAHSAVYARDYGLEITGDKDQVTAQWHPVHREIYNKLTALLAKLTPAADATGKDEV